MKIELQNKFLKKINKCEHGYINNEKKKQFLLILSYIAIGILIFLIGYFLNKGNKANLFTVIAVLTVLPTAKKVVTLIVLIPYKSTTVEIYKNVKKLISSDAVLICDYVFTSSEKVMALDFLILEQGNAIGIISGEKQDINSIKAYLQKKINNYAPSYDVLICRDFKEMEERYNSIKSKEVTESEKDAVVTYLYTLAV